MYFALVFTFFNFYNFQNIMKRNSYYCEKVGNGVFFFIYKIELCLIEAIQQILTHVLLLNAYNMFTNLR
jgi:hypothetical protein